MLINKKTISIILQQIIVFSIPIHYFLLAYSDKKISSLAVFIYTIAGLIYCISFFIFIYLFFSNIKMIWRNKNRYILIIQICLLLYTQISGSTVITPKIFYFGYPQPLFSIPFLYDLISFRNIMTAIITLLVIFFMRKHNEGIYSKNLMSMFLIPFIPFFIVTIRMYLDIYEGYYYSIAVGSLFIVILINIFYLKPIKTYQKFKEEYLNKHEKVELNN